MNRGKITGIAALVVLSLVSGVFALKSRGCERENNRHRLSAVIRHVSLARVTGGRERKSRDVIVTMKSQRVSGIRTTTLTTSMQVHTVKAYGEVLDLRSLIALRNNFITAQADARKAALQLEISRNEYARAKALFKSARFESLEKLQNAEAAYDSDLADSTAAFENLSGIQGEITQEWGNEIAGWIREDSPAIKGIIDHQLSILMLTIPEGPRINKTPVAAQIKTADGDLLKAYRISVSPISNPAVQGVSYLYRAPTEPSLPAGTNIVAYLPIGRKTAGVVIPYSSVVWWNGSSCVFIKTGKESFVRKEVTLKGHAEGGWFVENGFKRGDEIVVRGAQLLLSEEFKGQTIPSDD